MAFSGAERTTKVSTRLCEDAVTTKGGKGLKNLGCFRPMPLEPLRRHLFFIHPPVASLAGAEIARFGSPPPGGARRKPMVSAVGRDVWPRVAHPCRAAGPRARAHGRRREGCFRRDDSRLPGGRGRGEVVPRVARRARARRRSRRDRRGGVWRRAYPGRRPVVGVGKGDSASARLTKIDLGQGKSVDLRPVGRRGRLRRGVSRNLGTIQRGAGTAPATWCGPRGWRSRGSSRTCPSLVAGKRVLEVGAGLGHVVGNAALRAGASAVCMCDVRRRSCCASQRRAPWKTAAEDPSRAAALVLDWSAIPETFCVSVGEKYDVVVAADVLYDASAARCVSDVVGRATKPGRMALLCDPGEPDAPRNVRRWCDRARVGNRRGGFPGAKRHEAVAGDARGDKETRGVSDEMGDTSERLNVFITSLCTYSRTITRT